RRALAVHRETGCSFRGGRGRLRRAERAMSAPQATLDRVEYRYPGAAEPALSDANLAIEQGSFSLLAGPSGGGKSTLLRTFNGLVPQFHGGTLSGQVRVAGLDPSRTPARDMAL